MSRPKKQSRLVWSSEGNLPSETESRSAPPNPGDGIVRVSRQTKGRRGKCVTLVTGIPLDGAELKALAKSLKQRCGCGGTTGQGTIEIQGEHRDTLVAELSRQGWQVKKVGG